MASVKAYANESVDRVPTGTYTKIICEAEERWGLKEGAICKATMLMYLKQKRKTTTAGKENISTFNCA
jgi:hypothetical protein